MEIDVGPLKPQIPKSPRQRLVNPHPGIVGNDIGVARCLSAACRTEGCLWSANSGRDVAPRLEQELPASCGWWRESGAVASTAGCPPDPKRRLVALE